RDRAPGQGVRGRRDGRAGDAALRPGPRRVAADALQGRGAGLPLLPRTGPRARPSAGRAGRAAARGDRRAPRNADRSSGADADVLVTGGLDRLWSDVVAAGADSKEAANVLANQFVATGVAAEAANAAELAKLVEARASIPRAAFDEALAKVGDPGFSAEPYV